MFNKDIFCPLPFTQVVARTDGNIYPCCEFTKTDYNLNTHTIKDFVESNWLKEFKQLLIYNQNKINTCEQCYNDEKNYGTSLRLSALEDEKFIGDSSLYEKIFKYKKFDQEKFPKIIEIHAGNLCNLKCLTCKPEDSSLFLSEDKILGISNFNQKDFNIKDEILQKNINFVLKQNIKTLDLRGGESLLVPAIKKVLLECDDILASKINLKFQTNGTICDEGWIQIFKKFKSIEFMISIDGFKKHNEYIRFPSKWTIITKNLEIFKKYSSKIYFNCVVSNLNILNLTKLLEFSESNKIYCKLFFLSTPEIFVCNNIPQELYEIAIERLLPWSKKYSSINFLNKQNSNLKNWEKFCQVINLRDKHRKNSIFEILPEYKKYWLNSIT